MQMIHPIEPHNSRLDGLLSPSTSIKRLGEVSSISITLYEALRKTFHFFLADITSFLSSAVSLLYGLPSKSVQRFFSLSSSYRN
jgi:hypothetical protein